MISQKKIESENFGQISLKIAQTKTIKPIKYFFKRIIYNFDFVDHLIHKFLATFEQNTYNLFFLERISGELIECLFSTILAKYLKTHDLKLFSRLAKYKQSLNEYTFHTKYCKKIITVMMDPTLYETRLIDVLQNIKININDKVFAEIITKLPDVQKQCDIFKSYVSEYHFSDSEVIEKFILKLPFEQFKQYYKNYIFTPTNMIYLYEHQQIDHIRLIFYTCAHKDETLVFTCLMSTKLECLDFFVKEINFDIGNNFLDDFCGCAKTKNNAFDKSLEWIHSMTCNKLTNAGFADNIISYIIKKYSDDVNVLKWFHEFKNNHDCNCNIKLVYKFDDILLGLFSSKKAYKWWIKNDLAIESITEPINPNIINLIIKIKKIIRVLDLLKHHNYNIIINSCIYPEVLIWCKNNDMAISFTNDEITLFLQKNEEFLKYYEIYDWLESQKK